MRAIIVSLAACLLTALSAQAQSLSQTSALQSLDTGNDARGWEAVGRLDVNGKGYCTGALIAPDLVLTAAHCMFDKQTGAAVDLSRIEFMAGLRGGHPEASRRVRHAAIHPSYSHFGGETTAARVRFDVALLQLDHPIRSTRIQPFELASSIGLGGEVAVVSYAQDRTQAPSLQEVCNVLGLQDSVLIMDCDVDFGASGSPIFRRENGLPRLVSVVSAMGELDGEKISLGMDLAEPIAVLRRALEYRHGLFATPPTSTGIIQPGERADALFLLP